MIVKVLISTTLILALFTSSAIAGTINVPLGCALTNDSPNDIGVTVEVQIDVNMDGMCSYASAVIYFTWNAVPGAVSYSVNGHLVGNVTRYAWGTSTGARIGRCIPGCACSPRLYPIIDGLIPDVIEVTALSETTGHVAETRCVSTLFDNCPLPPEAPKDENIDGQGPADWFVESIPPVEAWCVDDGDEVGYAVLFDGHIWCAGCFFGGGKNHLYRMNQNSLIWLNRDNALSGSGDDDGEGDLDMLSFELVNGRFRIVLWEGKDPDGNGVIETGDWIRSSRSEEFREPPNTLQELKERVNLVRDPPAPRQSPGKAVAAQESSCAFSPSHDVDDPETIQFVDEVILGGNFYNLNPCRVVDTRGPLGQYGGPSLHSNEPRLFTLRGQCGIPPSARAVVANVTIINPSGNGYLTFYPGDQEPPLSSAINFAIGQTRANNAILPFSTDGVLAARPFVAGNGQVHLVIDITGYFN